MADSSDDNDSPSIDQTEEQSRRRILYPIFESESDIVLDFAADLAEAIDAELLIGYVDVDDEEFHFDTSRDTAEVVLEAKTDSSIDVPVEGHTLTGSSALDAVVSAAKTYDINTIIMGTDASEDLEGQIAKHTERDTVVINDQNRLESVSSILVPIAGGPSSGGAVDIAGALAQANDAWIELVHIVEDDDASATAERADEVLEAGLSRLTGVEDVDTRVIEAADAVDEIIDETQYHDVTVIGAPQKSRLRRLIFGSPTDEIRERAQNTVVMVRRESDSTHSLFPDSLL